MEKTIIEYNVPFEVTEKQYKVIVTTLPGIVFHNIDEDGKYWIKIMLTKYKDHILNILKSV